MIKMFFVYITDQLCDRPAWEACGRSKLALYSVWAGVATHCSVSDDEDFSNTDAEAVPSV